MKTNKWMLAAMLFGAVAMVGCKDKNVPDNGGNNNGGGNEEPTLEIPVVEAPEAGKTTVVLYVPEDTPKGCYAIGTVNNWEHDASLLFEAVPNEDDSRWVMCTMDYAANMEIKVCAIPSDDDVAKSWTYQWGKNVNSEDPDPAITEDHTIILQGEGEFAYENQGQPKLKAIADGGVVFIQVKAWAETPVIKAEPAAQAFIKHPWNGGSDWTWQPMKKTADATFEYACRFGNNGVNIADKEGVEGNWYPLTDITVKDDAVLATGDSVKFHFVSEKGAVGKVSVELIEKGTAVTPDPVIITVRAKYPAEWTETATAWVWPTGGDGAAVTLEKDGDFYKYTTPEAVPGLNIIFRNGADWNGDANQTVNVENIVADTDYIITYVEGGKATVAVVE